MPCLRDKPDYSLPTRLKARTRERQQERFFVHPCNVQWASPPRCYTRRFLPQRQTLNCEANVQTHVSRWCSACGLLLCLTYDETSHAPPFLCHKMCITWKKTTKKTTKPERCFCSARFLKKKNLKCKITQKGCLFLVNSFFFFFFFYLMLLCYANQNDFFFFVSLWSF